MSTLATRVLRGREGVARAARAGLAGKGFLYVVVALLAAQVALGGGGEEASQAGAIDAVAGQPFGAVLVGVLAAGLTAYALWRLAQAVIGPVVRSSLPEPLLRVTFLVRGIGYGALAVLAWRTLLTGDGGGGGGGQQQEQWTRQLLELPFGVALVVAIGVTIVVVGLYQGKEAAERDFMEAVDTTSMDRNQRNWFERAGIAGHVARAVTYTLVGGFLIQAALTFDPNDGVGLGAALSELASAPFGTAMLLLVAVGLALYGFFCFAMSRHARVHEVS